jgi:hypothetical protein
MSITKRLVALYAPAKEEIAMKERKVLESGQAIVLLVVSLVVLLGFTALAIDGGMVYSDRRHAQNAADTSSLAGAGQAAARLEGAKITSLNWDCTKVYEAIGNYALEAAVYRASTNGYTVGNGIVDGNGVEIFCDPDGKFVDVHTAISAETPTSFAHLFISSPLQNNVDAIARVNASEAFGGGNALLALNTSSCLGTKNGMIFSGDADVDIAGSAFTNCCLLGNGAKFSVAATVGVYYHDEDACGASGTTKNISPSPDGSGDLFKAMDPWEPVCGGPGSISGGVATPGTYTSITQSGKNDSLTMQPGLYCLTGKPNAFKITGGTLVANGVTLYVTFKTQVVAKDVEVTGTGKVNIVFDENQVLYLGSMLDSLK